jgi:hypothetical protein
LLKKTDLVFFFNVKYRKLTSAQMPRFNGNSHLRHPGLGETGLIWLELEVVFRSEAEEGLILYNGDRTDGQGDFMAVFMNQGYLEFAFDVGNGIAVARLVGNGIEIARLTWERHCNSQVI